MKNKYITILAAGKGSRMNGFVALKPFAQIANSYAILHIINNLLDTQIDFKKIFIIINELYTDEHKNIINDFMKVRGFTLFEFILQDTPQLGTGHAVKTLINSKKIDEFDDCQNASMLVLYADTPLVHPETIINIYNQYDNNANKYGVLCSFQSDKPNQYGRIEIDINTNIIIKVHEYKDYKDNDIIEAIKTCNSGIMCLELGQLIYSINKIDNNNAAQEYYLPDIIQYTQFKNLIIDDTRQLIGFNTIGQLNNVEQLYWEMRREKFAKHNVRFTDIHSVYFGMNVVIEDNVQIDNGCTIGPNVYIKKGSHIKSNTIISDAQIGSNCEIGPFATINSGSILGEGNIIGNFVEIKRSKLGQGNKAKHLAYIGDCAIADKNNFGAGMIVCNYDGKKKHKTNIGSNNMIGANSSLIAPLTIGDNNLIAAGSVINKDIGNETIAIERSVQQNKPRPA